MASWWDSHPGCLWRQAGRLSYSYSRKAEPLKTWLSKRFLHVGVLTAAAVRWPLGGRLAAGLLPVPGAGAVFELHDVPAQLRLSQILQVAHMLNRLRHREDLRCMLLAAKLIRFMPSKTFSNEPSKV